MICDETSASTSVMVISNRSAHFLCALIKMRAEDEALAVPISPDRPQTVHIC
jgi:hypothetical protein